MHLGTPSQWRPGAYSLLEVLVSIVILFAGILAILAVFPNALQANDRSVSLAEAALLAQRKAEEIRRDDNLSRDLLTAIRNLDQPTEPIEFSENPNLAYRFCGQSVIDPTDDPGDPRDDHGVARVIVQYSESFKPGGKVIYELRFDE
jgi:type II secretory pathway pseudopilin PulG